jgi:hypothetical protein
VVNRTGYGRLGSRRLSEDPRRLTAFRTSDVVRPTDVEGGVGRPA